MSTYTQWRAGADKGDLRRVTWVCGDQGVLVDEVVQTIRTRLASTGESLAFTAGTDPEPVIWAAANQFPLQPGATRLIVIRSAEKITTWEPLTRWLTQTRALTTSYLLFVAAQPDFAASTVDGKRTGLLPHLELIKNRGRIVRCATPNDHDAITWARRRAPISESAARHLLTRTGGDLTAAGAVLDKLALFPAPTITPAGIDALVEPAPASSFTDALLAGDKPAALRAATAMTDRDTAAAISLLDTRLDTLAALCTATRAGQSAREIIGINPYLVRQYLPIGRHYDPRRCVYARRVLAVCDGALRRGARTGVIEALVALW
jgi:DNA polymerase III delta subunit